MQYKLYLISSHTGLISVASLSTDKNLFFDLGC